MSFQHYVERQKLPHEKTLYVIQKDLKIKVCSFFFFFLLNNVEQYLGSFMGHLHLKRQSNLT